MDKLLKHLMGYLPVNIANGLIGFATVFVFTRLLGAEDYGRYALALSTLMLIHTFIFTWAEAAAYRFAGEAEAKGTLGTHYRTSLMLAGITLAPALLLIAGAYFLSAGDPKFQAIIPWLALNMPASVIGTIALESYKAERRIARFSVIETFRIVGAFLIGVMLAWIGGMGAASPIIGLALAALIVAIKEGHWMLSNSKGSEIDWKGARRYAIYGVPIGMALVLDLLLSAADRFLIAIYIDEAAVGAYAAGYGVADKTILLLCSWAAMAGSPLLMEAYEKQGKQAASEAARSMAQTMLLIAVPAAVGIALVATPLAEVMIGEELRDQAVKTIPWIAFAGLFNGFVIHFYSEAYQLAHKTTLRACLMAVPAALNIILNIVMLPMFGLMGAVYATVISYGVAVVLLGVASRPYVLMSLPLLDLARIGVACAAMAGVVSVLPDLGGLLELMLKAGLGGATYVIIAVMLDAAGARSFLTDMLERMQGDKSTPQPT